MQSGQHMVPGVKGEDAWKELIDVYDSFEVKSVPQLCINFPNEKLQQLSFKAEERGERAICGAPSQP